MDDLVATAVSSEVRPRATVPDGLWSEPDGPATVVICTRNRSDLLPAALRAALVTSAAEIPVLIIDQGDDTETTARIVAESEQRHRVRHVVDDGRGASRARNLGLSIAQTPVVVFIDDDCEAHPGAITLLVEALTADPTIGVAFGTVAAPAVEGGFIPTYLPPRRQVLRGRLSKLRDGGIGALMAVRRDASIEAGGFDERIGAGTFLAACEDGEFAYRLLRDGAAIAHIPEASVMHRGFRDFVDGAGYSFATYRGIGAAYATHLRDGDPAALALLAQQFLLIGLGMARAIVRRRHLGVSRLRGLTAGIARGLRMERWGRDRLWPATWEA